MGGAPRRRSGTSLLQRERLAKWKPTCIRGIIACASASPASRAQRRPGGERPRVPATRA